MSHYWILVADAGRARLFATAPLPQKSEWHELQAWLNPTARISEQAIHGDRQGRANDSSGRGRHAMERPSARTHEMQNFARMVAEQLQRGLLERKYDRLILVAPPEFMGELRKHLSKAVHDHVHLSVDRDFSKLVQKDLQASLIPYLNR